MHCTICVSSLADVRASSSRLASSTGSGSRRLDEPWLREKYDWDSGGIAPAMDGGAAPEREGRPWRCVFHRQRQSVLLWRGVLAGIPTPYAL